jgi:ATP adenylyltransferase/5',5'''-P-1,P-4-tetraphosphate phosphorylase II
MAGIVVRLPAENLNSDLLFAECAVRILQTALPQVQEQVAETFRFLE